MCGIFAADTISFFFCCWSMRLVAFEPLPKLIYPYYTFNAEGYDLLGANILQPTIYSRSLSLHSARLGKYLLSKLVFATNEFKEDLLRWA